MALRSHRNQSSIWGGDLRSKGKFTRRLGRFAVTLIVLLLVCLTVGIITRYQEIKKYLFLDDARYPRLIEQAARKHGVDSRLIKAVIYQESRFDREARGHAGEIGLMQLMPNAAVTDWARYHKVDVPANGLLFEPGLNIEIGTWYLAQGLKRWKRYRCCTELTLCQYNAGESRAENWKPENFDGEVIDRIKIESTRSYVMSVMRKYSEYCK